VNPALPAETNNTRKGWVNPALPNNIMTEVGYAGKTQKIQFISLVKKGRAG